MDWHSQEGVRMTMFLTQPPELPFSQLTLKTVLADVNLLL
jgi:hypothetical protein